MNARDGARFPAASRFSRRAGNLCPCSYGIEQLRAAIARLLAERGLR